MAILVINNEEYNIADGSSISDSCKNAGLVFNCNTGMCGSCAVKVLEGQENLSDITDEENDLGMDGNNRLACMCAIKSGTVKLIF